MLAIAVEFLTGRYVATSYNDRNRGEWPPHPARLFSALVATWAEYNEGAFESAEERAALEWLEQLAPPDLLASADEDVAARSVMPVFVPVNDTAVVSPPDRDALDAALEELRTAGDKKAQAKAEKNVEKLQKKYDEAVLRATAASSKVGKSDADRVRDWFPESRAKQPRTFPSVTPSEPRVAFVWEREEAPAAVRTALSRLLARLVRLGHSSSMVRAWLLSEEETSELRAKTARYCENHDAGEWMLRWVTPGQLERLVSAHAQHREVEPRVLPAQFVRYGVQTLAAPAELPVTETRFADDFMVFGRIAGPRLPVTSVAGLSQQFRRALMSQVQGEVPELISGHKADRSASQQQHLAIVPLPLVLGEHADGTILGIGLMLPRDCSPEDRRALMTALHAWEARSKTDEDDEDDAQLKLELGSTGELSLRRASSSAQAATLRARTWTGLGSEAQKASRLWASVTPVALDKNPGDLHDADPHKRALAFAEATSIVRGSLTHVLDDRELVASARIDVVRSCVVQGSAKPRSFPRYPSNKSRPQRVLVHVRLAFPTPVKGPLLIGAGRYQGLGLCVPIVERVEKSEGFDGAHI